MRWVLTATGAWRWCLLGTIAPVVVWLVQGFDDVTLSSPLVAGAVPVPVVAALPAAHVAATVYGARCLPLAGGPRRRSTVMVSFATLSWIVPLLVAWSAAAVGPQPVGWILARHLTLDVGATLTVLLGPRRVWEGGVAMLCGAIFLVPALFGSHAGGVRWWAYPLRHVDAVEIADVVMMGWVVAMSCMWLRSMRTPGR